MHFLRPGKSGIVASFASREFVTPISRIFLPWPVEQSSRERVAGKRAEKEVLPSSPGVMQPGATEARGMLVNEVSGDFFIPPREIKIPFASTSFNSYHEQNTGKRPIICQISRRSK